MTRRRRPESKLEQIKRLSRENVHRIIEGRDQSTYSEWLLKGELHEEFHPVAVVAAFFAAEVTSLMYEAIATEKQLPDYRQEIASLTLPERVRQRERDQYQFVAADLGIRTFFQMAPYLSLNLKPAALLVFSRPPGVNEESVYLFSPTLAPPTPALNYIKRGVEIELR